MKTSGFIAIQLNDSDDNLVDENKISISNDGIAIQLNRSKNNKILRNEILSTTQIEFLNKLNVEVQDLSTKTSDVQIKDLLTNVEHQINEVKKANQDTVLDQAHKLSETVTNVVTLGSEKLPLLAAVLTPYIFKVVQIFQNVPT